MYGEGESESEAGGKNIGVMVGAERILGEGGETSEERRGGGARPLLPPLLLVHVP